MTSYFLGVKFPFISSNRIKKAGPAVKALTYGVGNFIDNAVSEME
jgi:hypothetical protein